MRLIGDDDKAKLELARDLLDAMPCTAQSLDARGILDEVLRNMDKLCSERPYIEARIAPIAGVEYRAIYPERTQ